MKYNLTERKCAKCGILKQSSDFYTRHGEVIGYCKPCKKEYAKKYIRTPEQAKEYYEKNKTEIKERFNFRVNNNLNERVGRIFRNSKQRSNKIGLEFDIDFQFCIDLFHKQNGTCALSGEKLELSGDRYLSNLISLDRKDSTKGYTKDNIQWVCVKYNMMKAHASLEDFIKMCKTVVEFNREV